MARCRYHGNCYYVETDDHPCICDGNGNTRYRDLSGFEVYGVCKWYEPEPDLEPLKGFLSELESGRYGDVMLTELVIKRLKEALDA